MPSRQETFDKVLAHARKMTHKSMGMVKRKHKGSNAPEEMGCVYRAPDGNQCFAGALIPDELYTKDMESQTPYKDTPVGDCLTSLGYDIVFVRYLQAIHDHYEMGAWEGKFRDFAREYSLNYSPPSA